MKKIDLHTHTTASDGIYSPRQLIDLARENGLVALAITDHDTVDGLAEAVAYAGDVGFRLFPGVEFSIDYDRGSFHLIGFNIDHRHQGLRDEVRWLADRRETRLHRIIDDLKKHGIDIPLSEVMAIAESGSVGRPHIARVMVRHGYASTVKEVFKNYLVKGKPGYVKKERIPFDRAVSLIKDAGGIAIMAHPISLEFEDYNEFEELLSGFVRGGVVGIEVYAQMHTVEEAGIFREIAEKHNLLLSGGSDFHGDKDEIIGYYKEGSPIPIEIYYRLEEYLSENK